MNKEVRAIILRMNGTQKESPVFATGEKVSDSELKEIVNKWVDIYLRYEEATKYVVIETRTYEDGLVRNISQDIYYEW